MKGGEILGSDESGMFKIWAAENIARETALVFPKMHESIRAMSMKLLLLAGRSCLLAARRVLIEHSYERVADRQIETIIATTNDNHLGLLFVQWS